MSSPYAREAAGRDPLPPERSVGELLSDLTNETTTLIRQEFRLATTELTRKASLTARQLAFIAAGLLLGTLALLVLLQSLVIGLAAYMPLWVSALIVGLVVAATAAALATKGITTLQQTDLKPEETIQSIEATKSLVEGQLK
jgi:hypothetical protein